MLVSIMFSSVLFIFKYIFQSYSYVEEYIIYVNEEKEI